MKSMDKWSIKNISTSDQFDFYSKKTSNYNSSHHNFAQIGMDICQCLKLLTMALLNLNIIIIYSSAHMISFYCSNNCQSQLIIIAVYHKFVVINVYNDIEYFIIRTIKLIKQQFEWL
jgi:hypothetical protein